MTTGIDQPALHAAPRRPRWRRFLPLLGVGVLVWVLSRLDAAQVRQALERVSLPVICLSSAWFSANLFIKAYRWQRLLHAQAIVLPHRVALAAFFSGQFYGQVTLGRLGELVRVEALMERGVSTGAALSSCIFDRLLDVFVVLLSGSVFAALVLGNRQLALLSLLLMLGGALAVAAVLHALGSGESATTHPATRLLARVRARGGLLARLAVATRDLATGMLPMLRLRTLAQAMLLSLLSWWCYFAALWQLAEGLGITVSRLLLTATAAFAALSALLPVTVSGLGARELIYIEVLQARGVPSESAVVLSLLHLLVMTLSATALGFAGVVARQRQHAQLPRA